ncbi:hypothetical protein BMR42_24160 [Escherichia coli]|uniref:hypothetical protein n=1 Tax=Escherichia coli TaxID=562 RepID=UPI000C04D84D|nr:hypothetical protein [Escherichia coli]PHL38128.1 hypothetical protein BMR42_24160 [Escherichia coli]
MLTATITFYKIDEFGFYRRNKEKYPDRFFGDVNSVFSDFSKWLAAQENLGSTCTLEVNKEEGGQNIFCKDYYKHEDGNEYLIILWNEMSNADNKILAMPKTAKIGSNGVKEPKTEDDDIIGLPSYFWFVPDLELFAVVYFKHSVSNIKAMQQYIKEYCHALSGFVTLDKKGVSYYTDGTSPKGKYRFKFTHKKIVNKNKRRKLVDSPERITEIVRKVEIPKVVTDPRNKIRRAMNAIQIGLRRVVPDFLKDGDENSKEINDVNEALKNASRQIIEVRIPFSGDEDTINYILDKYDENFDESATQKLGFKLKGDPNVVWLHESVIKTEVELDVKISEDSLPTAVDVMTAISAKRDIILKVLNDSDEIKDKVAV